MPKHNVVKTVSMSCQKGSADKVYIAQLLKTDDGLYMATYANGRRGSTLRNGNITNEPTTLEEATKAFDKKVKSKTKAGSSQYTIDGQCKSGVVVSDADELPSGIDLIMLKAIDQKTALALCDDSRYVMQQKHDGERRAIQVNNGKAKGINKRGVYTCLSTEIDAGVSKKTDCLIDGESMGNYLRAFDLLELDGKSLRDKPFIERFAALNEFAFSHASILISKLAQTSAEKHAMLKELDGTNQEGVVFKLASATAHNSERTDAYLKYKFYDETCVIVEGQNNNKRSVSMFVFDEEGKKVPVGNCTVPPNKDIPLAGSVLEVRYLYAYKGGSLFQPTFEKVRNDVLPSECLLSQLKYKTEEQAA